ncbi:MAG TPA: DUF6512 family protein [Lachnospiraceae bacterium]|nr:DUF6512 family protein [Lachnospiraceae bacterium]
MNRLKYAEIIGVVLTIILGSLLHFIYNWSGGNRVVALFSPMNESIWEHLKMLFFPYMLYTILEYVYIGKNYPNFITAKCIGVICGLILIPIVSTIYTSILETNYLVLDILLFILSIIVSYVVSYHILMDQTMNADYICKIILILITIVFIVFTLYPPEFSLFLDPTTNSYGINASEF